MDTAETKMLIPKLIDPSDMADHPDALSNMTYIGLFKEYQKLQKDKAVLNSTIVGTVRARA
jgi:hypothetical protein